MQSCFQLNLLLNGNATKCLQCGFKLNPSHDSSSGIIISKQQKLTEFVKSRKQLLPKTEHEFRESYKEKQSHDVVSDVGRNGGGGGAKDENARFII